MKRLFLAMAILLLLISMAVLPMLVTPSPVLADSPSLYESFNVGDDAAQQVYGNNWYAQTFLTTSAHTVSEVRLKIYRVLLPGTFTVSIRATDAGDPSGADLTSGTIDGDILTANAAGDWYTIELTEYDLEDATTYAIVVRAVSGNATNYVGWRYDNAAGYAGGSESDSANGGVTWAAIVANDFMFEVWGFGVLSIEDVAVYQSVEEEGDWLIVIAYKNSYPPYSPSENSREYFGIRYICGEDLDDFLEGGTASADTEQVGKEAVLAFDNDEGTRWTSDGSAFPHWIKYDLGLGNTETAGFLRIKANSPWTRDFILQGSNDDILWDDLLTTTAADNSSWQEWDVVNVVAYRYYQVWMTSSYHASTISGMWEIELKEASGLTTHASIRCPAWGYKPTAIYIEPDKAATLEWGSTVCFVRIIGNADKFEAPQPSASHTMTAGDWQGSNLFVLYYWVIATANLIGEHYGVDLTEYVGATETLNEQGATIFLVGIPYLSRLIPSVFPFAVYQLGEDDKVWTGAGQTALEDNLGATLSGIITNMAGQFGLSMRVFGGLIAFIVYLIVAGLIYKVTENGIAAVVLSLPVLILGAWTSLISLALIGVIGTLALVYLVYLWFFRTA